MVSHCKSLFLRGAVFLTLLVPAASLHSWAADQVALTWKQLQPVTAFPARASFATAYDPVSKKVIVFGGYDANGVVYNDTWTFDGNTWQPVSVKRPPTARFGASMAYDRKLQQIVMFGGTAGFARFSDTWVWDGATSKWKVAHPRHAPPAAAYAMIYTDPKSGHVEMYGGRRSQFYSRDTFQWTGKDWTLLNPTNSPYPRAGGIIAPIPTKKNVLVFGGLSDNWVTQNTWTWDGLDWTQLNPPSQPDTLYFTTGAYDPTLKEVIVFGGGSEAVDQDTTWSWDGSQWTPLAPLASPDAREQFGTVWDSARHQLIIFGGTNFTSGQFFGDTWRLVGR